MQFYLDLKEIKKIKAGIEKYLVVNAVQKNKERASASPVSPSTSKPKPSKLKSPKKIINNDEPVLLKRSRSNLPEISNLKAGNKMPTGFYRNEGGKLKRIEQKSDTSSIATFTPQQKRQKTTSHTTKPVVKPIQQKKQAIQPQKPKNDISKPILNKPSEPPSNSQNKSVSEIARLFGGNKIQTTVEPVKNNNESKPAEKVEVNKTVKKVAELSNSKSVERGSNKQSQPLISVMPIENNKFIGVEHKLRDSRKRSSTSFNQNFNQNYLSRSERQVKVKFSNSASIIENQYDFDENEEQNRGRPVIFRSNTMKDWVPRPAVQKSMNSCPIEEELREKYSLLTSRLENLKAKVKQECAERERIKGEKIQQSREHFKAIALYKKYSPLKKFTDYNEQYKKSRSKSKNKNKSKMGDQSTAYEDPKDWKFSLRSD